jgi:hypothetical protein
MVLVVHPVLLLIILLVESTLYKVSNDSSEFGGSFL